MAKFTQVNIHVDRSSYPAGSICELHYEYYITFNQTDLANETHFSVFCELWGIDTVSEKRLVDEIFDHHGFNAKHSMDVARSFVVHCETLNEKVGKDMIFIILKLVQDKKIIDEIRSDIIYDAF